LWPVSREQHPKPFIRLADRQSLLQKAFLRGAALPGAAEVLVVTNRELLFKTEEEFAEVNQQAIATSYILEPFGRNTAAAVACAALQTRRRQGGQAVLLVLAADHLIADQAAFAQAVARAVELAGQGRLVTFGIQPDAPETGYGYIEADGERALRFVEKPALATAREYLDSGRFLWNSGMFCLQVDTVLRELAEHCPDVLAAVQTCLDQSREAQGKDFVQLSLDAGTFAAVPDISIDYALMEKSSNVAVVPCDIGWSDIGSWAALSHLGQADGDGNCIEGQALLHDVHDCFIQSPDRLVGAVGVENLIIVDTPDALLVADKRSSQDVRHIYAALKARGDDAYKTHRTVYRPWGSYTVLEEGRHFKIKRLKVKPGGRLSLQMHHQRSEHWVVVSGTARVINGERELLVNTNESTYIAAGHKHRLENPTPADLIVIEVQSGPYLGEDDIVRYDDIYGRA
jgi:mannose-1-phosphate guanylyltransferase